MTLQNTDDRVGQRIKARRLALGKSQRLVADAAGIAHTTLGRIERGELAAINRFTLDRIAEALHCPVRSLTGTPVPGGRDGAETTAAGYETVRALLECDLDLTPDVDPDPPALPALVDATDNAIRLRQACDYAALTRRLPSLVRSLYSATAGENRDEALGMLVRVSEAASFAVRYTGDPAAATVASDAARRAAVELGDPVMLAFGEWARSHSALGCGLHKRAMQLTAKAISELDRAPDAHGRLEMLGMLHLTHAFSLVGLGRNEDAVAPMAEAEVLARRTGETDTFALMFGPTNVRLWELAILTDGGDPLDAVRLSQEINVQLVPSISRQATFYIDTARATYKIGEVDSSVRYLEAAERLAPQRVHGDPIVVETVAGMLDTLRRRAASQRLLGLAQRVGVGAA